MKRHWKRALIYSFIFFSVTALFVREIQNIKAEQVGSWTQDLSADCGIVLTGGAGRVREGFSLLSQKRIKKLIISGVNPDSELREIMPHWPFFGSLSERDVILERRSATTYGNAQQTLDIAQALRCRDVLLITSRLHMSRAYRTFAEAYPPDIGILKQTIISSSTESRFVDLFLEAAKAIFYSIWAY